MLDWVFGIYLSCQSALGSDGRFPFLVLELDAWLEDELVLIPRSATVNSCLRNDTVAQLRRMLFVLRIGSGMDISG